MRRLWLRCPGCGITDYQYILRRYPSKPVQYDMRCAWCERPFAARYPGSFWRWLKRRYELSAHDLLVCQALAFAEDSASTAETSTEAGVYERIVAYVERFFRPLVSTSLNAAGHSLASNSEWHFERDPCPWPTADAAWQEGEMEVHGPDPTHEGSYQGVGYPDAGYTTEEMTSASDDIEERHPERLGATLGRTSAPPDGASSLQRPKISGEEAEMDDDEDIAAEVNEDRESTETEDISEVESSGSGWHVES